MALIYSIWLGQYIRAVGAPPFLCFEYHWINVRFNGWLHLLDYIEPSTATQLIADFFQFLFACQQWHVFSYETNEKDYIYIELCGSNREIIYDNDRYKNNPIKDFVTNPRHWLDQFKYGIFMYGVWFVLLIVYLAGTIRISSLGLGYLIACFYLLLYGQNLLTKDTNMIKLYVNYY
ncbi:unnamed protein product [Rotaria sordida]|uniref:Piezo TM25-28 domain-containing protein n=2 Tax=Rotaria sordida TaxID=392033 RepID=A0A815D1G6_9BILA|nr:unnamed protein product [Rotaria sordida]